MSKADKFLYVFIILIAVVMFFIPTVGVLVLFEEFLSGILLLLLLMLCLMKVGELNILYKIVVLLFLLAVLIQFKDVVTDFKDGAVITELDNCRVTTSSSIRKFMYRYYLHGEDTFGNDLEFRVSYEDYLKLKDASNVQITGYINTRRLVDYSISQNVYHFR